ncbi:hypothetical protein OIU77_026090 [Salix suchowensis]|uniref:Uncharacterized protein n=1 Tax=Salix suchowensis TaxID=1278906 RepID=A0ABQ9C1K6_9ROSI|nr:hypothetical protein OIU77_026090 [Salix suchowensis]
MTEFKVARRLNQQSHFSIVSLSIISRVSDTYLALQFEPGTTRRLTHPPHLAVSLHSPECDSWRASLTRTESTPGQNQSVSANPQDSQTGPIFHSPTVKCTEALPRKGSRRTGSLTGLG